MPVFLALLFLSFLPCIIKTVQRFLLDCMSAIANQKFNQLYLQGYQPLQNRPEDCCEGPTRTQEPEDPAPYNAPRQPEAARGSNCAPIPSPTILLPELQRVSSLAEQSPLSLISCHLSLPIPSPCFLPNVT
jgi:hypothetical protein